MPVQYSGGVLLTIGRSCWQGLLAIERHELLLTGTALVALAFMHTKVLFPTSYTLLTIVTLTMCDDVFMHG